MKRQDRRTAITAKQAGLASNMNFSTYKTMRQHIP